LDPSSGQHATVAALDTTPRKIYIAILALLVWLPLQTPAAIYAFQYLHLSVRATQVLLLLKDAGCVVLLAFLLVRYRRHLKLRWFDWLAVAYAALVVVYSIVPLVVGTRLPLVAIIASAREFIFPVELYAIGRLAIVAGVRSEKLVLFFIAITGIWASLSVSAYLLLPPQFWSSTLDLVTFERVVQGLSNAHTLWDISILGQYGVGDSGAFPRAVAPFTHPVGTAHYFLVPLILVSAFGIAHRRWRGVAVRAGVVVVTVVLAAAVLTPISRAAWLAAFIAVGLLALLYRRFSVPALCLVAASAFVAFVPPFSYSIASAIGGTDSSVVGHQNAIEQGVDVVAENPMGLGLGQADHFGAAYTTSPDQNESSSDSGSGAVGENMYLSVLVSVGPVGLAAFLGWLAGVAFALFPGRKASRGSWMRAGAFALLTGLLFSSLTASPLMRFTTAASFWLLMGLIIPAGSDEERDLGFADPYTRRP
jgi:hypothetical protein